MSDNFKEKYTTLLCDVHEVYNWIKESKEYFEKIRNEEYKKGALNRIENILINMSEWIPQIKSGECREVYNEKMQKLKNKS